MRNPKLSLNQIKTIKKNDLKENLKINEALVIIFSLYGQCEWYPRWDFLTLRRPLRRKLRMRWFFDVFRVKESSFSKSDLTYTPSDFWLHLLETTDLSPSTFHFSVGFISRSCFESDGFIAYSNEWDWREKNDAYSH